MTTTPSTNLFDLLAQLEQSSDAPLAHTLTLKGSIDFALPVFDAKPDTEATPSQHVFIQSALSLLGAAGNLPEHYTELIQTRLSHQDPTLLAFCDILHNHLCHTFYQAWKSQQLHMGHTHATPTGAHQLLASLAGHYDTTQDLYRRYTGFFSKTVRPGQGLAQILKQHFNYPFKIIPFMGKWIAVDQSEQTLLSSQRHQRQHNQLGKSCLMGRRTWFAQNRFQIDIGPLSHAQYTSLLPNHRQLSTIEKIAHEYTGGVYEIQLQLTLKQTHIPKSRLTHLNPLQLGYNTWLKSKATSLSTNTITFDKSYQNTIQTQGETP